MANKIVQIMQYNGSGNDNLIPLTAQQADFATNAINAQNAVIGQYASSDTSKGTIEQRLTFLEGSQTSMSYDSGVTPVGSSTVNKVYRSGNLCLFTFKASFQSETLSSIGTVLGYIPENFRPYSDISRVVNGKITVSGSDMSCWLSISSAGRVYVEAMATGYIRAVEFSIGYSTTNLS